MNGKVSVIIPAYQASGLILETLDSIANQTYTNWEVVVVEDGTNDGTEKIVSEFASKHPKHRVQFVRHEKNRGVGPSRNTAMENAQGDYLAFLDSDDIWQSLYLETMVNALEASKTDIAYSAVQFFDHHTKEKLIQWGPTQEDLQVFPEGLFERNFIAPSGAVIRKEVVKRVGGFDVDPLIQSCEDHDYWLRCLDKGLRFQFVPETYSWYRKNHGNQATDNFSKILERDLRVLHKHKKLGSISNKTRRHAIANLYTRLANEQKKTDTFKAIRSIILAWKEEPLEIRSIRRTLSTLLRLFTPARS